MKWRNKLASIYLVAFIILFASVVTVLAKGTELLNSPVDFSVFQSATDTVETRFQLRKDVPEDYKDLEKKVPVDLKTPENVKTTIEYDEESGNYIFVTKVGQMDVGTPIQMSQREYTDFYNRQSFSNYWKTQNAAEAANADKDAFSFTDIKIDIGPAEKIFGPGGVQLKTTGSAELKFGFKTNNVDNPSLPVRQRKKTYFDFDEKISMNMTGKVGDKLSMSLNYNTGASFDFDRQKLKLAYQGKEDEIIKTLEAGNVSMTTGSSLIRGGTALFGVKTDLQFGKLKVTALVSQQQSQTKSVSSQGGVQTTPFEIPIDEYEENRHFFLSQYFRDQYDTWMSKLPYVSSGISINRVEVWITNKRSNYDEARNIVAFVDLGETQKIYNNHWVAQGGNSYPANKSNTLYQEMLSNYTNARNISLVNETLYPLTAFGINGGDDFEKIESARKLSSNDYTINKQLGYISLNQSLQPDEVLAVAFDYTLGGQVYQVGEFASDNNTNPTESIYLKLLKSTAMSPQTGCWDLMMKNVYSLGMGVRDVQKDKFKLNVMYLSDTTGTYLNYIPEGEINKQLLIKVMNLDRLDSKNEPNPDGIFDFVEGYTILASKGKIIFPVVEPFGTHLRQKFNNNTLADKYVYQELYDSTLTVARQIAEKNKFVLRGEYKGKAGAIISLGATSVPQGSVTVTAGGQILSEGTDYTVDYLMGEVTIINQAIAESGTPISVSLEDQSTFSMQRKTMLGLDLNYAFNENFTLGGTVLSLREKPLTTKVSMGNESVANTIWGLNTTYKKRVQWLTNAFDFLPLLNLTQPSMISFNGEFAHLIPGNTTKGISYIDDFETAKNSIPLLQPYAWNLAATPYDNGSDALFPEAALSNNLKYGMNRAHLSWYSIDAIFTRKRSSLTPNHIKNDVEQLSNHFVREVNEREIYPSKDPITGQSSLIQTLNVAFYPEERGAYNLDIDGMGSDGKLLNPTKRWGGIFRKIDNSDFEAANVENIEFWLMDPFVYDTLGNMTGGDLYFNLGEISEDILKDGKKFFENGLPADRDPSLISQTVWGNVPNRQSTVYAFDNAAGTRKQQDVGMDGLSNEEEYLFTSYKEYVEKLRAKLLPTIVELFENDRFSPLNDPAGDNYHYYRGSDYDREKVSIFDRYKRFNGTEGNSAASGDSPESYDTSAKTVPDVEDINQDNTLNEYEKYYQYKIELRPEKMHVGENFIVQRRDVQVQLRNGKNATVAWYQFKVPISDYQKRVGSIRDFKTIRFVRMFMTGFEKEFMLRFGTLELVRGNWRRYEQSLLPLNATASSNGTFDVSTVNIEENGTKTPVNYVLPPGIDRSIDPEQSQVRQQNEQAMAVKIYNLAPNDARAVYKKTNIDVRQYKRLQMFVHAEKFIDDDTNLKDAELSVFIRMGSDYKNNYYEYEIPMELTPHGVYNTYRSEDQRIVWPQANMFDFPFTLFTDVKLQRNSTKVNNSISYSQPFSIYDPDKPMNKVTVVGNPSVGEVKTIMIGIRNKGRQVKSGEVWMNELRLTEFNEDGGWAARGNMNIAISDFGNVTLSGRAETAGFGSVDQRVMERRLDNFYQYNVVTGFEMGKFFPEKAKVSAPFSFSISNQTTSPKYNPLDQDVLLKDALSSATSQSEKDSIKDVALKRQRSKSFSVANFRVGITSKNPMPWDPSNFGLGYTYATTEKSEATIDWETTTDQRGNFSYQYTPVLPPITPFGKMQTKSPYAKILKELSINPLPNSFSFGTDMSRHYYELQLRDIENALDKIPLSFQKDFLWNRDYAIRWDLTKAIKFNFASGNRARIDEPNVPVNKKLYPDEYEIWKDSVMKSIAQFGRMMAFDQTFDASFAIPLNKIPVLDFVQTSNITYKSAYNWARGAYIDPTVNLGNTIRNQGDWQVNTAFSFEKLYDKSKFLKEANKRFAPKPQELEKKPIKTPATNKKKTKFEREVQLNDSASLRISHGLDKKDVIASAKTMNGKKYKLKWKTIDHVTILIENRDTVKIKLTVIIPDEDKKENPWKLFAQGVARGVMSVRTGTVRYSESNGTMLPGFKPIAGEFIGQDNSYSSMAPGIGFAFGLFDPDYIKKAAKKDWLISNSSITNMASITQRKNFSYQATIEPVRSLKIELSTMWDKSNSTQVQFMYDGMPEIYSGTFSMSTIAIGSAFERSNAKRNYSSKTFNKFQEIRSVIAARMQGQYEGLNYPTTGFMEGNQLAGQPFNPSVAGVSKNSTDVLAISFLAAYTGKDEKNVRLNPFPKMLSALPNWKMTYDGLSSLPVLRKHLKTLQFTHAYNCKYNVANFASYSNWVASSTGSDLGFVSDVQSGNPVPSSAFDITSISITESFTPLIGVNTIWQNNITAKFDVNRARNLALNMSANQIVESLSQDYKITLGYKFANFSRILGLPDEGKVNNDLNITGNITFKNMSALLRKIQDNYTQATSGNRNVVIGFAADYTFNRFLTIRAYYDRQMNTPLISSAAYPVTSSDFGISLRFSLNR